MSAFTPGPWRWELSKHSRTVHLRGGVPRFDLTVMDFVRWGTQGAAPRFRDDVDRMNIMRRCDEHSAIVPGREHHEDWFRTLAHPDAQLMATAPELCEALRELVAINAEHGKPYAEGWSARVDAAWLAARAALAKATGR